MIWLVKPFQTNARPYLTTFFLTLEFFQFCLAQSQLQLEVAVETRIAKLLLKILRGLADTHQETSRFRPFFLINYFKANKYFDQEFCYQIFLTKILLTNNSFWPKLLFLQKNFDWKIFNFFGHRFLFDPFFSGNIVKTQRNSTQLKATLKQLALELDTVATCSTHPLTPTHTQTFQPLLDMIGSWNLAQTITRPT